MRGRDPSRSRAWRSKQRACARPFIVDHGEGEESNADTDDLDTERSHGSGRGCPGHHRDHRFAQDALGSVFVSLPVGTELHQGRLSAWSNRTRKAQICSHHRRDGSPGERASKPAGAGQQDLRHGRMIGRRGAAVAGGHLCDDATYRAIVRAQGERVTPHTPADVARCWMYRRTVDRALWHTCPRRCASGSDRPSHQGSPEGFRRAMSASRANAAFPRTPGSRRGCVCDSDGRSCQGYSVEFSTHTRPTARVSQGTLRRYSSSDVRRLLLGLDVANAACTTRVAWAKPCSWPGGWHGRGEV